MTAPTQSPILNSVGLRSKSYVLGQVENLFSPVTINSYPTTANYNPTVPIGGELAVKAGFGVFMNDFGEVYRDTGIPVLNSTFVGFATMKMFNESSVGATLTEDAVFGEQFSVPVLSRGTIWVYNCEAIRPVVATSVGLVVVIENNSSNPAIINQYQLGGVCNGGTSIADVTFVDISNFSQIRIGNNTIGGGVLIDLCMPQYF